LSGGLKVKVKLNVVVSNIHQSAAAAAFYQSTRTHSFRESINSVEESELLFSVLVG
jgi:hypothetical protein